MSLTIVVMVTLSSEAMAEASTNENATSGQASTNENATSGQASTNENATSGQASTNENATSKPQLEESQYRTVKENGTLTIDQSAVINNFSLPVTFCEKNGPSHGKLSIKRSLLTYIPDKSYTGGDKFSFIATPFNTTCNTPNGSNPQKVTVAVGPKPPFPIPPEWRIPLAFGLSLGVVLLIFYIAYRIIRKTRKIGKKIIKTKFWDIVRDDNWYPSLAIFQFLMWTGIVLFAYFGIALTRFFSGIGPFTEIPINLLYVMGISAGVPVLGTAISRFQYAGTTPPNIQSTKEVPSDQIRKNLPGYKTMLMENGKITLTRFQMFAWTWIGIIAYLGLLYLATTINLDDIEELSLPTLPTLFLSLMGISQATYLGAKSVKTRYFSINEVRPQKVRLEKEGNYITVLGSNFGTNGTVWLEYYPPLSEEKKAEYCPDPSKEEKEKMDSEAIEAYQKKCDDEFRYDHTRKDEEFDVTPKKEGKVVKREDNRIVVSLDSVMDKLKPERYVVRVERDGLITYANSDAIFDIIYGPPKADSQSVSTEENNPLKIILNAEARDAIAAVPTPTPSPVQLTYSIVENPSHGTLSNFEPNTGKLTYIPSQNYFGDDSFKFKSNDGKTDGNIAIVTISIKEAAVPTPTPTPTQKKGK
jgi:hypothetical protein